MVKTIELVLSFTVEVSPKNIHLVKQLAQCEAIDRDPDEIEVGEELDVDYVLEGEFSEWALPMVMLFNSCEARPKIKITRGADETNEQF